MMGNDRVGARNMVAKKPADGIFLSRPFLLGAALSAVLLVAGPAVTAIYFAGQTINRLEMLTDSVKAIENDIRGKIADEMRESRDSRIRMSVELAEMRKAIAELERRIK